MNEQARIPVICVDPSAVSAFAIFNSNDWSQPATRGVIQACATELAALEYTTKQIVALCRSARAACLPHFETLKKSWGSGPVDTTEAIFFGQIPALHVLARAFFGSVKSLLDLNAQLLSTEGVVGIGIDGFHRKKDVYGGVVISSLDHNVTKGRERVAAAIKELLLEHKAAWADELIRFRDVLVHPLRGAQQLMFELRLESRGDSLVYVDAVPPHIGTQSIAAYAEQRVGNVRELSSQVVEALQSGRPTSA